MNDTERNAMTAAVEALERISDIGEPADDAHAYRQLGRCIEIADAALSAARGGASEPGKTCHDCGEREPCADNCPNATSPHSEGETGGGEHLMRCNICGFIIDTNYEATKPTIDFTTRGRGKRVDAFTAGARAGRETAAHWHDERRRNTPDAFEGEFHEVSATTIRALDLPKEPR